MMTLNTQAEYSRCNNGLKVHTFDDDLELCTIKAYSVLGSDPV